MNQDQLQALAAVASLALSGSPLSILVLGLVQFFKKTGMTGNPLTWLSMGLGVVFGGVYMFAVAHPVDLLGYFLCVVYGLLLGLVASGVYDVTANMGYKAAGSQPAKTIQPTPPVAIGH